MTVRKIILLFAVAALVLLASTWLYRNWDTLVYVLFGNGFTGTGGLIE